MHEEMKNVYKIFVSCMNES